MRKDRPTFVSAALYAAISWCIFSCSPGPVPEPKEISKSAPSGELTSTGGQTSPAGAAYTLENITYTQSDAGKVVWEMTAGSGTEDVNGQAKLKEVRIVYFPENGGQTTATAKEGLYDLSSRNAQLVGDVVITSSRGITIETQSMHWFQDRQVISSENEVIVRRGSSQVKGVGFKATTALGELELRSVSGVLQMSELNL